MIMFSKDLLSKRVDNAVKRLYLGHGVFGCIESFKMEFDEDDENFYGTIVIRYGRYDKDNREDLNFNKTIEIHVGPKDLENYDFFEGMVYALIDKNDK